jgi:hypothetical protein
VSGFRINFGVLVCSEKSNIPVIGPERAAYEPSPILAAEPVVLDEMDDGCLVAERVVDEVRPRPGGDD